MPIKSTVRPTQQKLFRSSSGRTALLYFRYGSGACGGSRPCNFRGSIKTLPGFDQVEVFLRGFTIETASSAAPLGRISAQVQKHRYDATTGRLEMSVDAQLGGGGQGHSFEVSFVVVLTDSTVAKFTSLGNGCNGVDRCTVSPGLGNAVPAGMQYIGLGTSTWDLGYNRGAFPVHAVSGHVDSPIVINPPGVAFDYVAALQDAQGGRSMFMEWGGRVIAFEPSEMTQSPNPLFPQHTFIGTTTGARQTLEGGLPAPGPIQGVLDAFDGLSLFYRDPAVEHDVWRVEASAKTPVVTPPSSVNIELGIHLGTTFGDRTAAEPHAFQVSRAFGYLL
jgi:hypothetical protein